MGEQKEIYFDNSSTTRPSPEVVDVVVRTMTEDFGNPSSMHKKGMDAEGYVRGSARTLADILKCAPEEICFTSGGTEANNLAVIGTALAKRRIGKTIITTSMEHPAVSEPFRFLEKEGFTVRKVPVDEAGRLDLEALSGMLTEDVILVSTMYVNNEIGAVVPVREVAELVHAKAPRAYYHVDAIQAFGKYRIHPHSLGIDMLSASGHKFHGPKGTGFLYIGKNVRIEPLLLGGGQQRGLRSGTENVPGIAGLGVAAKEAYTDLDAKVEHLYALKERMTRGLSGLEGVTIHGMRGREGAPHIVNASFDGVGSEVLLHALEERGIYISAGSACSTHKRTASPTLTAIGAPSGELTSAVRFSFSETNTEAEVDETLAALKELLPYLRKYQRH